jgi:transposase
MKLMLCVRRDGLPTATLLVPANRAENQLVEPLLEAGLDDPALLEVLLGDRAFDDDGLRDRLQTQGIFLLAPHRKGRKRPPRHDGRHLRRYRRRYLVERTNSWLQAFRRLPIRYEWYSFLYHGFVSLACLIIVARGL